jgi:hypothetical protein
MNRLKHILLTATIMFAMAFTSPILAQELYFDTGIGLGSGSY